MNWNAREAVLIPMLLFWLDNIWRNNPRLVERQKRKKKNAAKEILKFEEKEEVEEDYKKLFLTDFFFGIKQYLMRKRKIRKICEILFKGPSNISFLRLLIRCRYRSNNLCRELM